MIGLTAAVAARAAAVPRPFGDASMYAPDFAEPGVEIAFGTDGSAAVRAFGPPVRNWLFADELSPLLGWAFDAEFSA